MDKYIYLYCLNNPLIYTDPTGMRMIVPDDYGAGSSTYSHRMTDIRFPDLGDWDSDWLNSYLDYLHACFQNGYVPSVSQFNNALNTTPNNGTVYVQTGIMDYYTFTSIDGRKTWQQRKYINSKPIYSTISVAGDGLGFMKDIGTGADYASGVIGLTQVGMLEYRMSLPISSKIGTFSSFSSTYKGLGFALKGLSGVGYVGAFVGLGLDIKAVSNGNNGLGRFGYRTGSLGLSIYTVAAIGGPWGAVGGAAVGGISVGCEYIYDNLLQPLWREVNYQIWNFENALKNGWYPGR